MRAPLMRVHLRRLALVHFAVLTCLLPLRLAQADWQDWWLTPEQRVSRAYQQGEHETVIQSAPDAGWVGLGQYQAGDYDAASASFADRVRELHEAGIEEGANQALYNQGVSDVRAGRYERAIDAFDQVLQADPTFEDAAHNLEIARQLNLIEQRQQQGGQQDGQRDSQQSGEQSGEQSGSPQQSESGQAGSDQAQSQGNQSQGDPSQTDQAQGNQAQGDQQSGQSPGQRSNAQQSTGNESSSVQAQSEAERARAADQARRALAAEAEAQAEAAASQLGRDAAGMAAVERDTAAESGTDADVATGTESDERPMSESEQAGEQLLRRIPDDPAGLLRRKLEQSHRVEYPEVRDAPEPW